jgi:hypothetical protein
VLENFYHWGNIFVWEWLDAAWSPIALILVHKGQRLKACAFIAVCMMVMRLQIQIFDQMGFAKGITGFIDWPLIFRGYGVYGVFILLFIILSYFSPFTRGAIYLAASLSIFFMAFTVSSIVLIL